MKLCGGPLLVSLVFLVFCLDSEGTSTTLTSSEEPRNCSLAEFREIFDAMETGCTDIDEVTCLCKQPSTTTSTTASSTTTTMSSTSPPSATSATSSSSVTPSESSSTSVTSPEKEKPSTASSSTSSSAMSSTPSSTSSQTTSSTSTSSVKPSESSSTSDASEKEKTFTASSSTPSSSTSSQMTSSSSITSSATPPATTVESTSSEAPSSIGTTKSSSSTPSETSLLTSTFSEVHTSTDSITSTSESPSTTSPTPSTPSSSSSVSLTSSTPSEKTSTSTTPSTSSSSLTSPSPSSTATTSSDMTSEVTSTSLSTSSEKTPAATTPSTSTLTSTSTPTSSTPVRTSSTGSTSTTSEFVSTSSTTSSSSIPTSSPSSSSSSSSSFPWTSSATTTSSESDVTCGEVTICDLDNVTETWFSRTTPSYSDLTTSSSEYADYNWTMYYSLDWNLTSSSGTTTSSSLNIIDVGQVVTYSTSGTTTTASLVTSDDVTTRSSSSQSSQSSTTTTSSARQTAPEIVDITNVITYPTSSDPSSTAPSTTSSELTSSESKTTSGPSTMTTRGLEIVDVSDIITYSTPSTSSDTSSSSSSSSSSTKMTSTPTSTSTSSSSSSSSSTTSTTSSEPSTSTTESTPSTSTIEAEATSTSEEGTTLTPSTTTEDPACAVRCPDGYISGATLCFLVANVSEIASYQLALSFCQTVDLRNLISLEHLRNLNDLTALKSSVRGSSTTSWFFANGGGSVQERFNKEANVFDINALTAMTSPVAMTVGISESTSNISAICVLPQYCNVSECFIDSSLTVLGLNSILTSSEDTILSKSTASITCSYTKTETSVSCGSRGNLMPNPTQISCQPEGAAQKLTNTTAQTVSSCSECFNRGTSNCTTSSDGTGFVCHCKNGYSMSTCWYTSDSCTSSTCSGHGVCSDTMGEVKCDCDWGFEGDACETTRDRVSNTTDAFFTRLKNSFDWVTVSAGTTSGWTMLTIVAKSLGKVYLSNGEDDPQETHQALRSILMTFGSTCVLLFHDPYLFKISQATCRMFFILIHFSFLGAMIQWMLEGYNANQVVRCIHLNEWERDFKGKRAWGIMAAPRLVVPMLLLSVALAVIFQTNWYELPSTWTCVGVICNSTTSVYLAVLWIVIGFNVATAAFAESSILLTKRRPLYNLKIRQRIERNEGVQDGWVAEKCRRNTILCSVGVFLLSAYWLLTILASDKTSQKALGWLTMAASLAYGFFSFVQGAYTDPTLWSSIMWMCMKRLPARFAPSYDPISMWTREEVKRIEKMSKLEQRRMRTEMLPRNKRLFLHHKWDLQLNERLAGGDELNASLLELLRNESTRHEQCSGSPFQKRQLHETFAEFVRIVSDRPPRDDLLEVRAKSEAVTLCAEKDDGSARVTRFMLVPRIDVFEPEESSEDVDDDAAAKRLENEVEKENYKIAREEAVAQNNFMNSAIKFRYYGKIKA